MIAERINFLVSEYLKMDRAEYNVVNHSYYNTCARIVTSFLLKLLNCYKRIVNPLLGMLHPWLGQDSVHPLNLRSLICKLGSAFIMITVALLNEAA